MAERLKIAAIVLAAGSGSRMNSQEKKQFMDLNGLPVLAWSLLAFEENPAVDDVILVTGEEDLEKALKICLSLKLSKVKNIVAGGDLRFRSVYNGLLALSPETDYVLIHDAARPLITQEIIRNCIKGAVMKRACVAAVKEKNTIKKVDEKGYAIETIDRSSLYEIQTPQAFDYKLILRAYYNLKKTIEEYHPDVSKITDDAVIVENMTDCRVSMVEGDYKNIKITTPEDLVIARALMHT
ncbi:MAG: 2-C-methyl-D-erythritol 4-phosphate cytidylyltransferase [Lachnospiraceae bacterium]|nr:2-C-methyl-D-erythritol 4-phosphate cytidylyltransferase [Lachnospiraceae bacterium]